MNSRFNIPDIISRYLAGESTCQIGRVHGADPTTIRHILKKHHIKLRPISVATKMRKKHAPSITVQGYRKVWVGYDHPLADGRGQALEHRLVVSQHLGRFLSSDEVVHHIDGNKLNNSLDNLKVMSPLAHLAEHRPPGCINRRYDEPNPTIRCACGCGATLLKYHPTHNYPRRFATARCKADYAQKARFKDTTPHTTLREIL